jgi:hypothetical protein
VADADLGGDRRGGAPSVNLFRFLRKKKPCYRCGGDATVQYMGLDYCSVCRLVIVRMLPVVGMGGMFGFPGSSGYLEFPDLEKKES